MEEEEASNLTPDLLFKAGYDEWEARGAYTWIPVMLETDIRASKSSLFSRLRNRGYNIRRSYIEHHQRDLHFIFVKGSLSRILWVVDRLPWVLRVFPIYALILAPVFEIPEFLINVWIIFTVIWGLFILYFGFLVPVARDETILMHPNQN